MQMSSHKFELNKLVTLLGRSENAAEVRNFFWAAYGQP